MLRYARLLIVAILVACIAPTVGAGEFLGIEMYPSGDIFVFGKKELPKQTRALLWAVPNSEVGFTFGPNHSHWHAGAGFSAALDSDGYVAVKRLNLDLRLGTVLSGWDINTYSLWQGNLLVTGNDYSVIRVTADYKSFPVGLFGQNEQVGDSHFAPQWGVQYRFGKIGQLISVNNLALAVNLRDRQDLWAAYIMELDF